MSRLVRVEARGLPEVLEILRHMGPASLVMDVEPLVVSWNSPPSRVNDAMLLISNEIRRNVGSVQAIVFATNSRRFRAVLREDPSPVVLVQRAGKPWRRKYAQHLPRPMVVIGDQIFTDGLLAVRLGASFVHVDAGVTMPAWPRVQRLLGRSIQHVIFGSDPSNA